MCTCILESSSTSTFCVIKMMLILLLSYQKALVTCTYKSLIEFFHGTFIFVTSSSNTNRLKYSHWLWKTNSGILSVNRHNYRLCVVYIFWSVNVILLQEHGTQEYTQDDLEHEMALEKEKLPQIPTYTETGTISGITSLCFNSMGYIVSIFNIQNFAVGLIVRSVSRYRTFFHVLRRLLFVLCVYLLKKKIYNWLRYWIVVVVLVFCIRN